VLCEPDAETYLVVLFDAQTGNREYDTALATIQKLIALHPTVVNYHQLLASLQVARKDWPAGEAAATAALQINPLAAEALILRSICREQQGRRAEAKADADAGLALQSLPEYQNLYRQWLRQRR
jgi:tetratricopeptide (TPR) repeat protein